MDKKDTNPKDAVGTKKVPFSTIPAKIMGWIGLALLEGAIKYARHNYRVAGVRASVYYDACFRHLTAWWEGEDIDKDSGLPHPIKAIACLVVLMDSIDIGNWTDDRPPKTKDGWVQDLNKKAEDLINRYPKSLEPYTELNSKKDEDYLDKEKIDTLRKTINKFEVGDIVRWHDGVTGTIIKKCNVFDNCWELDTEGYGSCHEQYLTLIKKGK